jgi:hypothetical protein
VGPLTRRTTPQSSWTRAQQLAGEDDERAATEDMGATTQRGGGRETERLPGREDEQAK